MINQERWQELLDKLKLKFPNLKVETEDLTEPPAHREIAYLSLPHQELRLVWSKKPRVLDKKTHYSNRGGTTQVDYEYAEDDYVFSLAAEAEQNGQWLKTELTEAINYFS